MSQIRLACQRDITAVGTTAWGLLDILIYVSGSIDDVLTSLSIGQAS